jgi:hypothetical protein
MSNFLQLSVGDILEMKKQHPCGGKLFKVLRVGADIKISCLECGRSLTLDRLKIEKMVKRVASKGAENE